MIDVFCYSFHKTYPNRNCEAKAILAHSSVSFQFVILWLILTILQIFNDLRKLVGISRPSAIEGLSCTILRSGKDYRAACDQFDSEVQAEHHSKLCVALKVLHECFMAIIEPRTQSDIVADILFNKEYAISLIWSSIFNYWSFFLAFSTSLKYFWGDWGVGEWYDVF